MSRDRIRYGVIGMGRQGERYIRHIRLNTNHAELIAVTRSDSRKGSRPIKLGKPAMTVKHVLRDATQAFRGKQPLKITVHDSLASLAIAQACYRSAQSKKREKVLNNNRARGNA